MRDTVISWDINDESIAHVHDQIVDTLGWLWAQNPTFLAQAGKLKCYTFAGHGFVTDGHFGVLMATDGITTEDAFGEYEKAKKAYVFEPQPR